MDDLELLGDFVEEAREHLSTIEIQLLQIEAMGEAIDDTLINTVFIAIHSVKGASGSLGLTQINAVSHRLEDVLARVREKQLVPDPYIVAVMLKAADRLKSMIESIETSEATDNTVICENLEAILSGDLPQDAASSPQNAASAQAPKESANEHKPTDRRGSAAEPKTPTPKSRKTSRKPNQPAPQSGVSDRVSESLDQIDSAIQSVSTGIFMNLRETLMPSQIARVRMTAAPSSDAKRIEENRSMVCFQTMDLTTSSPLAADSIDILFRRNVLIDFTLPTNQQVLRTLASVIRRGGVLLLSRRHSKTLVRENFIGHSGRFRRQRVWEWRRKCWLDGRYRGRLF